ncbi:MAG: 4-(cytidine 5'-diphospho)-2-C-methyl-D-erythritol kinase [Bacteroidetes bacterium]|nr:MAG: 4-(cytidine 5'-diphospho)-2-C-methyl-D-erythritol kinase [Bacteroidota bacterium]
MIAYPNAKINLGLNVLRKRTDGYHDIESVFYPVPWQDILEIVPERSGRGRVTFTSSGISIPSDGKPDLCERVYCLMHETFDLPAVKIHLHKMVPIGAGLGGGSADAAFTAVMLNEMFQLKLSTEQLEGLLAKVGSDCPFFVQNRPAYVTGKGELLEPFDLDLSGYWMVLVNPGIHIGTKEAYAGIVPSEPMDSLKEMLSEPVSEWKNGVKNDFEASIFPNHPEIAALKSQLYEFGAAYSSMTGSGSTVFGLFDRQPEQLQFAAGYSVKTVQLWSF